MLFSEPPRNALPADTPKRSSITRMMMPFRSSKNKNKNKAESRESSIDSGSRGSSMDQDRSQDDIPRRGSKPFIPSNISNVQTNNSVDINGSTKFRKPSTVSPQSTTSQDWDRDRVTGERKDPTSMLHSLAHDFDAPTLGKTPIAMTGEPAQRASDFVRVFPARIWRSIISSLSLADQASLFMSCKPFRDLCDPTIIRQLNDPDNFRARCDFLYYLNDALPNHILCYICGRYHPRTQIGAERLRPTNIANPLYYCPYATSQEPTEKVSKHRITFGRSLPLPFVQLVTRHDHHGPNYGIPHDDLSRRYKDKPEIGTWSHQTRYAIIEDHLHMRVVSVAFAQPNLPDAGMRQLLYSREDFTPFFSVCAHWRDGVLMPACKCALSHIPSPLEGSGVQRLASETVLAVQKLRKPPTHQTQFVSQCETCKPLRRCPECPTEYLIEIRLHEDRTEKDPTKTFKQAIVVTRWSDLGDGSAPWTPEWAAVQGDLDHLEKEERYDSFQLLGRRAISGTFESFFNPEQIPPQRLMSLNPDGERLGEKGHGWY